MARQTNPTGTDVFEVAAFPTFERKQVVRVDDLAGEFEKAQANPGAIYCVRQYKVRGSAEGCATTLRKKYPDGFNIKVGPLEGGDTGVFIQHG